MYRTYDVLQNLAPEAYLNPAYFTTGYDIMTPKSKEYQQQQYEKGLKIGRESSEVFISANGTWGAHGKRGSLTTSYEGIGYHSGTAELLRGFLDSGCKISVYRYGKGKTVIKE